MFISISSSRSTFRETSFWPLASNVLGRNVHTIICDPRVTQELNATVQKWLESLLQPTTGEDAYPCVVSY